jgi:hypothetical protein
MFLYDVQPTSGQWVAQCTRPVTAFSTEDIAEGFGIKELREITFDCEQSWIIPDQGESPGWYISAIQAQNTLNWPSKGEDTALLPKWFSSLNAANNLSISYIQSQPGSAPPFVIFESFPSNTGLLLSPSEVNLGEILAFRGFIAPSHARPGATIDILTSWRILSPHSVPISLMLHLKGAEDVPIAVGDGLGIPSEQWRSGDILIQRHTLEIPEGTPQGTYTIETGAYELDTLQRIEVIGGPTLLKTSIRIDQ